MVPQRLRCRQHAAQVAHQPASQVLEHEADGREGLLHRAWVCCRLGNPAAPLRHQPGYRLEHLRHVLGKLALQVAREHAEQIERRLLRAARRVQLRVLLRRHARQQRGRNLVGVVHHRWQAAHERRQLVR